MKLSALPFDNHLTCPRCRSEYLHHGTVTIYDRAEDEPDVTIIEVKDQIAHSCVMDNEKSGNPSLRRDGLVVEFWCEHCDAPLELVVLQHKGQTYVAWRGNNNGHADDCA
jgi:hypothetical protein